MKASGIGPRVLLASAGLSFEASRSVYGQAFPGVDILREIDDPHNGDRWLLMFDPRHPAGPAKLLRVPLLVDGSAAPAEANRRFEPGQAEQTQGTPALIVRAGDRIELEESTPVLEVHLAGVAMGSASAGSPFNARLSVGGRVVRAVATAPGRARLDVATQVIR